jgi:hypothetical protein
MAGWKEVKRIAAPVQRRELRIMEGPHGLFRFDTLRWIDAAEEDEGALGDGYWTRDHFSGLYQSADEAEQDARSIVPWLRALEISN